MMERTYISNVKTGERNKIQGFVENIRNKSKMAFIVVKDVTGKLQLAVEKEKFPADFVAKVDALTLNSVINSKTVLV